MINKIIPKVRQNLQNPGDVALFLRMAWLVLFLPILCLLPLPVMLDALRSGRRNRGARPFSRDKITGLANLLLGLNFLMFRSTCLRRSIVIYKFLREQGEDVRINFGVNLREKKFLGHCWLTHPGEQSVTERIPELRDFHLIYSHPAI